jgi:hypothetical protein
VPNGGPGGDYAHLRAQLQPESGRCWDTTQSNGSFTNCLKNFRTGNLLRSIATASSPDDGPRVHSKWDNSKYQFIGRSFGVGAPPGLTDREIGEVQYVQRYTYNEIGFFADTKCIYNESSALSIALYDTGTKAGFPSIYWAYGALPNSNWSEIMQHPYPPNQLYPAGMDYYVQSAFGSDGSIVSTFNRGPINDDTRWMFGMAAGGGYPQLDKIQCEITFEPSLFRVEVSPANTTIEVSRIEGVQVEDPDPTTNLRKVAADSYQLSYITTSLYTSTVGDSFTENIRNLQARRSVFNTSSSAYKEVVLDAIADSVTSVMDDTLVALGSAALTFSNATQSSSAAARVAAVQIGSKTFIWLVVAINVLGSVGIVVSCVMLYKADIPTFEYSDIGCVAMGLRHGLAVLDEDGVKVGGEQPWDGHPGHRHTGRLAMRLQTHRVR